MTHSLTLGSLLLTDGLPDDDHDFVLNVLAEGAGFGAASSVQEIVTSLLADGDLVRTRRYGNREVSFAVEITGPSLASLAQGEAALRRELGRPNTLTWQAPDIFSVPTVFEVLTSEMSQTFDDLDELRNRRTYNVTLTCSPFARSADPVTVAALEPPGTPVAFTVNNADSTTGWSATARSGNSTLASPAVTDQGDYVSTTVTAFKPQLFLQLDVAAVSMASTPYLRVEVSGDTASKPVFSVKMDGSWISAPSVSSRAGSAGSVVHFLDTSALGTSLSGIRVTRGLVQIMGAATLTSNVHDVTRTNSLAQVSPKQITRVIEVGGTERTPASVLVRAADSTWGLSLTVVHTCPEDGSGYSPPLRRWRISGQTPTVSDSMMSGAFERITGSGVTYDTPTSALPEGGYVLAALMRRSSEGTVRVAWSTSTIFPGTWGEQGFTVGVEAITLPDTEWHIVPIAVLSLPSVRTSAGKVRTILQAPDADGTNTYIDEAWLFRIGDDCALSIVDAGLSPNLWLNSPGTDGPVPTVWIGDNASARVHPGKGLQAMGAHVLSPQGTSIFTASMSPNAATSATFYRRWHSNAAE